MHYADPESLLLALLNGLSVSEDDCFAPGPGEDYWSDVAGRAGRLGVASLLYQRLKDNPTRVPDSFLGVLKKSYHTIALRNTMVYKTVEEPLRAFQAAGIPVIVLKGLHLAETVYGNIALRPMTDADILIQEQDIPGAEEILLRLGFDPPEHPRIRARRDSRIAFHKTGGAAIEVHWILDRPGSPFRIDHAGVWSRACPITVSGVQALALAPEDLLLHICWQASINKQFRKGLCPFFDMHIIINRFSETFDWEAFVNRAHQWNLGNCVYVSLLLAQEFCKTEIPREIMGQLQPAEAPEQVIAYAREQVFSPSSLSPKFLQLLSTATVRGKVSLVRQVFFPARDTLEKKYGLPPHACRVYLYYPVRWFYLARKYLAFVLRMLRRERTAAGQIASRRRQAVLQDWLTRSGKCTVSRDKA